MRVKQESGKKFRPDELDVDIIKELQRNARISYRALARKFGVSVTTISERVTRMVESGLIRNFTVIVDPEKAGASYCAALYIRTDNGADPAAVGGRIGNIEGICYIYHTLGLYNLIALGSAANKEQFTAMIREIGAIKGVKEVIPSTVIDTIKEDPRHPVLIA
ncbi:MAG: Lrp/AsnC family transcriptional regulator [Methanomassiliicoccales archaeon]